MPQVAENVDIVFIAVKPQYVVSVIQDMKPHLTSKNLLVSIAAGIPLSAMKVYHLALCSCACRITPDTMFTTSPFRMLQERISVSLE